MSDALLEALAPTVERLLDRHLATAREWFPHALVPWTRAAELRPDEPWSVAASPLPGAVRSALYVNLLTEDNLPHYFETISRTFAHDVWRVWSCRWAAEEMRHSIVLRDYVTVTAALDPVELERARMTQVAGAVVPRPPSVPDALVYVALQELATRVAHWNTGRLLGDAAGEAIMRRVAADENLHHLFYRDLVTAALEVDPDSTVAAIERQVGTFAMPGTGIPGFRRHAAAIAQAGIYDLASHHDDVLVPVVLRHWRLEHLTGLSPDADAARERTLAHIARTGAAARRAAARRTERAGTGVSV
jgi:acyl-[acyl-carrier-protein] desaturase